MAFVGLKIGFLWNDYDAVEVSIHASNGAFCGTTKAYVSHGALAETASILEGFPDRFPTRANWYWELSIQHSLAVESQ